MLTCKGSTSKFNQIYPERGDVNLSTCLTLPLKLRGLKLLALTIKYFTLSTLMCKTAELALIVCYGSQPSSLCSRLLLPLGGEAGAKLETGYYMTAVYPFAIQSSKLCSIIQS